MLHLLVLLITFNKMRILGIVFLFFFVGCQQDALWKEGDYFFFRNKGADMPIWVRGNIASKIFILHLHGGPGGSSINEAEEKVYLALEDDYAMVYWDQRGSGCSQGKAKPETINIDQFVEDLEQVIQVINQKYDKPTLFLMGHSWGGTLGTKFLIKENNQQKIQGWIEIDGAHNFKKGLELSVKWVKDYADEAIAQSKEPDYWQSALNWYQANPVINTKSLLDTHSEEYLNKANAYIYNPNNPALTYFTGGTLTSPGGNSNGDYVQEYLQVELSKGYSNEMNKITIPCLILWGKHDGIMPVELAYDAYTNLGTDSLKKQVLIFEHSAHSPNREEPVLFIQQVKQFIESYK